MRRVQHQDDGLNRDPAQDVADCEREVVAGIAGLFFIR
jgi:hypothetical protein